MRWGLFSDYFSPQKCPFLTHTVLISIGFLNHTGLSLRGLRYGGSRGLPTVLFSPGPSWNQPYASCVTIFLRNCPGSYCQYTVHEILITSSHSTRTANTCCMLRECSLDFYRIASIPPTVSNQSQTARRVRHSYVNPRNENPILDKTTGFAIYSWGNSCASKGCISIDVPNTIPAIPE